MEEAGMFKEWWANPAVVGLMGFALTTMATGLSIMGFWGGQPTLCLALAFGGTAQFIAGVVDLRKGNLFGGSAFMSYGAFWWAVFLKDAVLPLMGVKTTPAGDAGFALMWFLFTFAFMIASFKVGKFLSALFVLLWIAFGLLILLPLGMIPAKPVGVEVFVTGLLAWYIAMAEVVNTAYGKKVLPIS